MRHPIEASHTTLFISDLHLARSRPDITERFEAFLGGPARRAESLFILGDLFEAWIGDDAVGGFEKRIAGGLRALADRGTRLWFLHGNRDFLLGREFCSLAGMRLLDQPQIVDLYGTPTVLLHGDQLCTLDVQYQRYRKRASDPDWQARMLARPIWFRRVLAALLRGASRLRSREKSGAEMDAVDADVEALFRRSGSTRMIHGHTHRPFRHVHRVDGARCERIVLGDWYTQGSMLTVTPASVSLDALQGDVQSAALADS